MNSKFNPYYAVVFTSTQTKNIEGYSEFARSKKRIVPVLW